MICHWWKLWADGSGTAATVEEEEAIRVAPAARPRYYPRRLAISCRFGGWLKPGLGLGGCNRVGGELRVGLGRGGCNRFGGVLKAGFGLGGCRRFRAVLEAGLGLVGGCSRFRGVLAAGLGLGVYSHPGGVVKVKVGLGLGLQFGFGFGFRPGIGVSFVSVKDDGHAKPEGRGGESRGRTPADESGLAGGERKRLGISHRPLLRVIVHNKSHNIRDRRRAPHGCRHLPMPAPMVRIGKYTSVSLVYNSYQV